MQSSRAGGGSSQVPTGKGRAPKRPVYDRQALTLCSKSPTLRVAVSPLESGSAKPLASQNALLQMYRNRNPDGTNGWTVGGRTQPGSDVDSSTERDYRSATRSDPSSSHHRPLNGHVDVDVRHPGSITTLLDPIPNIPYWSTKRHLTCGNPTPPPPWASNMIPWRATPSKLKTANAALVLCLNIDVDPPDIVKTNPGATLECWVDPHTLPTQKALDIIGMNLAHQFEGLSPKITFKPLLDPAYDDLRKYCHSLRKTAKDDAILFYYNGHGVPKPTPSGEMWCFNKEYTQYIPVSLQEVQSWLLSPCVYIWDCSAAGHLLQNFLTFAKRRDAEAQMNRGGHPEGTPPFSESIQLAACAADEQLPSCPELPADLFTSCLTSPIDMALRWFHMQSLLPGNITMDMVMQLPGDLKDRRTPLGELNWIFTAITDTIAWTTFPRDVFTRLYRSDLLVASLFRNFLLAERIMKNYHCTPHTYPPLPATNTHPLWASWDLAVDACLRQLPELLKYAKPGATAEGSLTARRSAVARSHQHPSAPPTEPPYTYVRSRFFGDQLTAFEVWISRGGSALTKRGPLSLPESNMDPQASLDVPNGDAAQASPTPDFSSDRHLVPRKPPDQLPIVLQVLLSQPHRLRALILLSQFVDLGPWAVHLVLTIGIFPYISRLLQAASPDLRPVLIFIWARIFAGDPSCQMELYNNQGYKYFAAVLAEQEVDAAIPNNSEHKAMCAFILSAIARDYPQGQHACWRERVFDACFERLGESDFLIRQWSALCIAQIWDANDEIKTYGVDMGTQDRLIALLTDDSTEVRSAALYALSTFMGASGSAKLDKLGGGGSGAQPQLEERLHLRMEVAVVTGATLAVKEDASPMVRKELLVLISCLVKEWRGYFIVCAWIYWEQDRQWKERGGPDEDSVATQAVNEWLDSFEDDAYREENRVLLSSYFTIFVALLELSVDPYQEVATNAQTVVDYIMALLLESPFSRLESTTLKKPPATPPDTKYANGTRTRVPSLQSERSQQPPPSPSVGRPGIILSDTVSSTLSNGVTNTIRRTSSFANALKNLAGNIAFPSIDDGRSSPKLTTGPTPGSGFDKLPDGVSRPPSPNLSYAQYTSPYSRPSTPPPSLHLQRPSPHPSPRASMEQNSEVQDYAPWDVMEALIEEDTQRLKARRRVAARHKHHHPHHPHHPGFDTALGSMSSPAGSTFSMDSSIILGLGTGVGVRDVLPLKSRFYDWCSEYFKEPQMRQPEAEEPGSIQYNYQVWRQQRNEQVNATTRTQAEVAADCRWDRPVTTIHNGDLPLSMAFHAYDPHLVIANETDVITVWDWMKRKRLNKFFNGNPRGTCITSLHIVNQEVGGIILTAAADGVIRLYRNYDPAVSNGPVQMVSSFRGTSEVLEMQRGAGIITDWKQIGGTLLVGGDSRIIRAWDAHTESQVMDLNTNSESPLTAIISDDGLSSTFLAGFADGVVKLFDRRLDEEDAIVRSYNDHGSWIQKVKWYPAYDGHLDGRFFSASVDGEVKLWDIRGGDRAIQAWDMCPQGLSAFDVHDQAEVFATTSSIVPSSWRSQRTMVQSLTRPTSLSALTTTLTIPPSRDPLPPYVHRSSSLSFHPREMLYGVGLWDGSVRIMGCKLPA